MLNQKKYSAILIIYISSLFFQIFAQKNKLPIYNPDKNASIVINVNMKQIAQKAPNWRDYIVENLTGNERLDNDIREVIQTAGINLNSNIVMFVHLDKDLSKMYMGISASLTDVAQFEKTLKDNIEGSKVQEKNAAKYIKQAGGIIIWKDQNALFISSPEMQEENMFEVINNLSNEKNTLLKHNEPYKKLLAKGADISLWGNYQDILKMSEGTPAEDFVKNVGMISIDEKYSSLVEYVVAKADFQNGSVNLDFTMLLNKTLAIDYKKLISNKGIHKKIIQTIPTEKPIALTSLSFDPLVMYEALQNDPDFEKGFEDMKENTGLTAKEFFTMLSGDFVLHLNDLDEKGLQFDAGASIGIKNSQYLATMLSHFDKLGMIEKDGLGYKTIGDGPFTVHFIPRENNIFILTDANTLSKLASKNLLKLPFKKFLQKNISYFYIDFKTLGEKVSFLGNTPFFQQCKSIDFKTGSPRGLKLSSSFDMLFHNKQENALVVLLKIMKETNKP